jgi:hypothetical protein
MHKMHNCFQQINNIDPGLCTEVDFITTLVASLPELWDTFTQSIDFTFDHLNLNRQVDQIIDFHTHIIAEAHRHNVK